MKYEPKRPDEKFRIRLEINSEISAEKEEELRKVLDKFWAKK